MKSSTSTFNKEDIQASKVSGTKSNEALSEYSKGFKEMMDKRNDLNNKSDPHSKRFRFGGKSKNQ